MVSKTLFSSRSEEWGTPQDLFDYLDGMFHFDLDAAASVGNAKCSKYYSKDDDALLQDWVGRVWLNPPYGKQIYWWMKKAYESVNAECVVVLVHARTDTKWWHDWVMRASEVWFIEGRLKFVRDDGVANSATFPSVLVVFDGGGTPLMRALKKSEWKK